MFAFCGAVLLRWKVQQGRGGAGRPPGRIQHFPDDDSSLSPHRAAVRGPAVSPARIPVSSLAPLAPPRPAAAVSVPSGETSPWVDFVEALGGNSLGTHPTKGTEKARVMPRHAPMCDPHPGNHQPRLSHWKHACLHDPVWASLSL